MTMAKRARCSSDDLGRGKTSPVIIIVATRVAQSMAQSWTLITYTERLAVSVYFPYQHQIMPDSCASDGICEFKPQMYMRRSQIPGNVHQSHRYQGTESVKQSFLGSNGAICHQ